MKSLAWKVVIAALYGVAAAAAVAAVGAVGKAALPAASNAESRLGELAAAVLSSDYRGDRAELARLDAELGRLDAGSLNDYRDYWRGFALWRRAMNGFSEKPAPTDLDADLVKALERFQSALARHPDWDEVKCAMLGAWGNRIFLAGSDAEKRKKLLEEAGTFYKWVMAYEGENPRVLWIKGGLQMIVPPASGGDWTKAAATLRQGVEGAWKEASAATPAPPWAPTWGGAENLMNLAYLYSHLADAGPRHGPGVCGGRPHESARVALRQGRPASADRGAAGEGGRRRGRAATDSDSINALTALAEGSAGHNNRGSNP